MNEKKRTVKKVIGLGDSAKEIWETVKDELELHGIDLAACCDTSGEELLKAKVVCVTPDLKDSVEEMGRSQRDQVVMVRVDEETSRSLDAWVESGAVKSRSEAAALFIREGLKVRSSELEKLQDALRDVQQAKDRLRRKAQEVFGGDTKPDDDTGAD